MAPALPEQARQNCRTIELMLQPRANIRATSRGELQMPAAGWVCFEGKEKRCILGPPPSLL